MVLLALDLCLAVEGLDVAGVGLEYLAQVVQCLLLHAQLHLAHGHVVVHLFFQEGQAGLERGAFWEGIVELHQGMFIEITGF